MIGFLIVFFGTLLFTHIQTFDRLLLTSDDTSILKATWTNFIAFVQGEGTGSQTGGGMIGAILFAFSYYLFSLTGAKIVSVFTVLVGLIFLTEFSLGDFFGKLSLKLKNYLTSLSGKIKSSREERKLKKEEAALDVPDEKELPATAEAVQDDPIIQDFTDVAYAHSDVSAQNSNVDTGQSEPVDSAESETDLTETLPMTETENHDYTLPAMQLLTEPEQGSQQQEKSHIQGIVRKLERTFQSFGVKAKVSKVHVGPAVTKYEVYPEAGVKVSKIVGLHDDLALALAARDLRIEAPIPGKSAVGIEVPNKEVAMVSLREVLESITPGRTGNCFSRLDGISRVIQSLQN
ncbi:DNA translocase FtsK [Lentibacillus sp. JNUCC-1]|nr:DNA translocase FtsK [Lentibacillus sp. JNUCC-1]